jgi:hypothetical protein
MDTTIFDPVQGFAAGVTSSGDLKVEARVPATIDVNVASTTNPIDVNVDSTTGQIPTTPGAGSSVDWDQVDVDSTTGGTEIVASHARKGILIANLDASITVYLGFGGAPTNTTGFPIRPGTTFSPPAGTTMGGQILAITQSGTARVAYLEIL